MLVSVTLILVMMLAGCLLSGGDTAALADEARPNVILVMADDQGWGDLSSSGNTDISTPNIDSLAEAGASFDRFYVNSFCAPTRAALLTGRYPLRCGVWGVTHSKETMRASGATPRFSA